MNLLPFIENALAEDTGDGDHSSLACIPASAAGTARLIIKDHGILAGVELARQIFIQADPSLHMEIHMPDGSPVQPGSIAFTVKGSARIILGTERFVLNCMQRMSGIATLTHRYVTEIQGLNTKILDTRKTTPGFREMEKWAVRIGGGANHRMGLYDMIMLKDNHIDYAGGITKAVERTKQYLEKTGKALKIVIEARGLAEVEEIIATGLADRILLDNFSAENTKAAVTLIGHRCQTESSGGITLENVRQYAECGVDYISVGALTHSAISLDISLKAIFS